jgi:hypothetical protein
VMQGHGAGRPHRPSPPALGSRGLERRRPIMGDTRQRADGLLEAPRIEAVPAPQVDEAIHARGNVDVRARALVARRKGLSQEAPLDGSILGGHDVSWGSASWHLTAELSMSGGGSHKALGAFQTGLRPIREDAGASSGLLDGFTERGRCYAQLAGVRTDVSVVGDRHHIPPMWPETALGEGLRAAAAAQKSCANPTNGANAEEMGYMRHGWPAGASR